MSGTGVKFSDLIKQYDGSGDFSEWLKKLELVCKLQKVKDLQTVLPLFLAGGAFSVYDGLTENVKSDYEALTNALLQAFSANCFQAYAEFTARRLLPGESLDVYASDLKRLAKLVDPFVSDEWIKSAVVHGLPEDTQTQLKAACSLQSMELSDVMTRARNLLGSESNFGAVAQANAKVFKVGKQWPKKCFVCDREGHVARSCPHPNRESKVTCYRCGEVGHYASKCSQIPKNE